MPIFINETIDTTITKPFTGKTITLFHGSDKKFDIIVPNSRNYGNRLTPNFRESSFWCTNKDTPILFGIHQMLDENLNIDKFCVSFKPDMTKLLVSRDVKSDTLYLMDMGTIYVYEKTLPTKYVSRGTNATTGEYTVDIKIKPDNIYEYSCSTLKDRIEFVNQNYLDKMKADIKAGKKVFTTKSNFAEKLIYYSDKELLRKQKEYRSISK